MYMENESLQFKLGTILLLQILIQVSIIDTFVYGISHMNKEYSNKYISSQTECTCTFQICFRDGAILNLDQRDFLA